MEEWPGFREVLDEDLPEYRLTESVEYLGEGLLTFRRNDHRATGGHAIYIDANNPQKSKH